jgi:hypothetical protein
MSKNTGAINGWLDLTYTNKKKSVIALSGTEYQVGDAVKTFLQLSEDNIPINNATCKVNIYYPNNTLWQTNQSLVYQNGSNGLYFWQGVAQNLTGVYMVDALCQYYYGILWAFEQDSIKYPIPTTTTGSLVGTGLSLNSYQDGLFLTAQATGGKTDNYYDFNTTGMNLTNSSAVVYWMGQSALSQTPLLSFQVYNWTSASWLLLSNTLTLSGNGQSFATGHNDQMVSNVLNLNGIVNATTGVIRIRVNSTGTATHIIFNNWLSISFSNPTQTFLDNVRGGGEIHITDHLIGQTSLLNQILDYLENTIYPYLQTMWNKLLGIEGQLNTTINITNQSLVLDTEINTTTHTIDQKLDALNTTMLDKFTEKDAHIQSAYDNMTSQVTNLSNNVTQNFNQTWEMILALNLSQGQDNSVILSYLANITTAINNTQTQIANVNQSLNEQILNTTNSTQNLILAVNTSTQNRFDEIQEYLDNLTLLINTNHNITQENISVLMQMLLDVNSSIASDIDNLNTSLQETRTEILTEINQTYNYLVSVNQSISNQINQTGDTIIDILEDMNDTTNEIIDILEDMNNTIININETNNWILQELNISGENLTLNVVAPTKCLVDTNWLVKARVTDRFGNIQTPLDGMRCNMTTDLWGTSNMTYLYVEDKFKYIHVCDPAYTTFNWSVECGWV